MPLYDYRCKQCGKVYDVLHKGKEVLTDVVCPACGSRGHVRLFSAPSISIHGTESTPCGERSCHRESGCCGCECEG